MAAPVDEALQAPADFSLVLGGPLFQILRRVNLTDDALALLQRRILAISLFAWLPLLALSAVDGQMLGGDAAVPFLMDISVHVRFLVALPLLIAAELVVHRRMRPLVNQFLDEDLIPEGARTRFGAAVASALRLRNSVAAEVVMIAFVYLVGVLVVWRHYVSLGTTTWYATPCPGGSNLSPAGLWYGFVSLPVFQFLMVRWFFRLFIWTHFLWQVSRIELKLVPTHPDRAGGLGFLSNAVYAFIPLTAGFGAVLAGPFADRIFHAGARLPDFEIQIAAAVVLLVLLSVGPLLVFAPRIAQAKRTGILEYGALAQRYVRDFGVKWLRAGAPGDEPLLGSVDIQSLADMGSGYQVVRTMRMAPVALQDILLVALAAVAPMAPLLLTVMPLDQLLREVFGLLL